ncbi:hypothetical protein [Aneurinibacillus aneurinilyticus]|uniref:hypothetical protein n=1 Tax=Aneurinibacillus aneurinilyticus TaxID=1391 RepID=UPI0023F58410|nr:hypothetical protein [Aneurinibacillus aneurinilyticus]
MDFKVKIIKSSDPNSWYAPSIGQTVGVTECHGDFEKGVWTLDEPDYKWQLLKEDCEVVK